MFWGIIFKFSTVFKIPFKIIEKIITMAIRNQKLKFPKINILLLLYPAFPSFHPLLMNKNLKKKKNITLNLAYG